MEGFIHLQNIAQDICLFKNKSFYNNISPLEKNNPPLIFLLFLLKVKSVGGDLTSPSTSSHLEASKEEAGSKMYTMLIFYANLFIS